MMFICLAPHPTYEAIIYLPSPELQDKENPESRILTHTAMSGQLHTYVTQKQLNKSKYEFEFDLTRMKALELLDFIKSYAAEKWKIENGTQTLIANVLINPYQIQMARRSVVADSVEAIRITLEFET